MPRRYRRYAPPAPPDNFRRCGFCRARLPEEYSRAFPHFCKELTYGTAVTPLNFIPFEVNDE